MPDSVTARLECNQKLQTYSRALELVWQCLLIFVGCSQNRQMLCFRQAQVIHTHTVAINIKFTFRFHSTIVSNSHTYRSSQYKVLRSVSIVRSLYGALRKKHKWYKVRV